MPKRGEDSLEPLLYFSGAGQWLFYLTASAVRQKPKVKIRLNITDVTKLRIQTVHPLCLDLGSMLVNTVRKKMFHFGYMTDNIVFHI